MTPGFEKDGARLLASVHKSSFGPALWMLDAQARRDLAVYYAFCRAVDDSADDFGPAEARRHTATWARALVSLKSLRRSGAPLPLALAELCQRRSIPLSLPRQLVRGAQADARGALRLRGPKDLEHYCQQVAGSVGEACLPIFGVGLSEGARFARALGRALQLINIVRDVAEDAKRGRVYFSAADLRRHGLREKDVLQGGAKLQPLLRAYAVWARASLSEAAAAARKLPSARLRSPLLMRDAYAALLGRMEADGLRVFERRYRLPLWQRGWVLVKNLTGLARW